MDEENEKKETTPTENEEIVKEDVKEEQKVESTVEVDKKPKKSKKGLIISIIIILVIIIACAIAGFVYATFFSAKEIDLSKYISFETSGNYNGYASFDEYDLTVDKKGLRKIIDDRKTVNKLEERILEKSEVETNENVKNGDKIKVTIKISDDWLKEYKIKLKSKSFEITVKDLEEAEVIDLFKDVELEFSGISPNLSVSINNTSANSFIKYDVYYTMSVENGQSDLVTLSKIRNGDKITVKAKFDESDLRQYGYAVNETEHTYTVEGQNEYLKDASQLSQETKDSIAPEALEEAKSDCEYRSYSVASVYSLGYNYNLRAGDPELQKVLVASTDKTGYSYDKNNIFYIYKVTYTELNSQATYDYYLVESDSDIVVSSEGVDVDDIYFSEFSNYSKFYYDNEAHKGLDSTINAIKSCYTDYTFTEF